MLIRWFRTQSPVIFDLLITTWPELGYSLVQLNSSDVFFLFEAALVYSFQIFPFIGTGFFKLNDTGFFVILWRGLYVIIFKVDLDAIEDSRQYHFHLLVLSPNAIWLSNPIEAEANNGKIILISIIRLA